MTSRKLIAAVLAFFGPWGIGHFHLGWRARAFAWLAVPIVALGVLGVAVPVLGPRIGWGAAVALPFAVMFVAWAASFLDLLRRTERERVPAWQTVLFFVLGILGPIGASTLVRVFVLEAFVVPSQSMQPALLAGDHIFANKHDRSVHYGEVMVFASPEHPQQMLVKRIMALPNDILEMKSGRPYVNGWKVPSCPLGTVTLDEVTGDLEVEFLGDASYLVFYDASHPPALHAGPLYAAPDGVLVLGDDRNDSADSRVWHSGLDGNVHASALRGRALFVWLRESRADERHFGMDLDSIQLPSSLAAVKPALAACLASKPDATPPRSIRQ